MCQYVYYSPGVQYVQEQADRVAIGGEPTASPGSVLEASGGCAAQPGVHQSGSIYATPYQFPHLGATIPHYVVVY